MRIRLTGLATLALLGAGLVTAPSEAAPPPEPVSSISVAPAINHDGNSTVDVSWRGADPKADGTLVCVRRGTFTPSKPSGCESQISTDAPGTSSGPITIYPRKTYTIAVYDYFGTSPEPTYSTPVSKVRHGTAMTFHEHCPAAQQRGDTCRITGVLKDNYTDNRLGHRPVELWSSNNMSKDAHWSLSSRVNTNGVGHAETTITLDRDRLYQWRYATPVKKQLTTYTAQVGIVVAS